MKKINKLAIGLTLALIGCNTQKQPSSPTLPEVSRVSMEELIRVMTTNFSLCEKK